MRAVRLLGMFLIIEIGTPAHSRHGAGPGRELRGAALDVGGVPPASGNTAEPGAEGYRRGGRNAVPVLSRKETTVTGTELDEMGPIDYLVIEFPADRPPNGSALPHLVDLVERGIIRVLDLEFVQKSTDGSVTGIDIADVGLEGDLDVTLFAEAYSGLLDDTDLADAGEALEPGCSAAVLIYENTWAAPLATALRRNGAQLVASGRVPVQSILASLDALESES